MLNNKELLYKTHGIILGHEDANDADAVLAIYTQKRGKILVRARGVRKKESKLRGFCQLFAFNNFLLAKSRGLADVLAGAEEKENWRVLKNDLARLAVAFYISEVLSKLVSAPEKDQELWNFLVKVFQTLNNKKYAPAKIKIAFERRLLEILGYGGDYKSPINKIQALTGEAVKSDKFLQECLQ